MLLIGKSLSREADLGNGAFVAVRRIGNTEYEAFLADSYHQIPMVPETAPHAERVAAGQRRMRLLKAAVAHAAVEGWRGIGDENGEGLDFTPETLDALLEFSGAAGDAIFSAAVADHVREAPAEGEGSAASGPGMSGAASSTAPDAPSSGAASAAPRVPSPRTGPEPARA